jgi:anti-sigma regulatory factor (Ser/Thr protein kinase)
VEVTESSVLQLPFTASSVGVARRHLVSDLIEAGVCAPAVTDAALVISELLSNALRHAGPLPGSGIRVAWDLEDGSVRVCVSDGGGPTRPELGAPTATATGGRGLRIVARLSRRWGTTCDDEGTTVWAEVLVMPLERVAVRGAGAERHLTDRVPPAVSQLSACAQRSHLASGRAAR